MTKQTKHIGVDCHLHHQGEGDKQQSKSKDQASNKVKRSSILGFSES